MKKPSQLLLRGFTLLAVGLASSAVFASGNDIERKWNANWADHLPAYCQYTQLLPDRSGGGWLLPKSKKVYSQQFGEVWKHLHHYCFGLERMWEAMKTDNAALRRDLYKMAVDEIDYVLKYCDTSFVLIPEMYVKKGMALTSLGQNLEGVELFLSAIEIRDDYVPAYVALANYFERMGDKNQAAEVLRAGLKRVPDSEILISELRLLDPSIAAIN